MALTGRTIASLRRHGYLVVRGAVSESAIEDALRRINASIGLHGLETPAQANEFWVREAADSREVMATLRDGRVWPLLERLVGGERLVPPKAAQVALRFPPAVRPDRVPEPQPHVDGMDGDRIRNRTAIVGVFLTPIGERDRGNLVVWPGSHLALQRYFREHGPDTLVSTAPAPEVLASFGLDLGEPVQILAQPGDAVIMNYQLAHAAAVNLGPHIRCALYFRLTTRDRDPDRWRDHMLDVWLDWPGTTHE